MKLISKMVGVRQLSCKHRVPIVDNRTIERYMSAKKRMEEGAGGGSDSTKPANSRNQTR